MEKNLIKAIEKLEKLVNEKKIKTYNYSSWISKNKGKKVQYFDIHFNDGKIEIMKTAENVLNLEF